MGLTLVLIAAGALVVSAVLVVVIALRECDVVEGEEAHTEQAHES